MIALSLPMDRLDAITRNERRRMGENGTFSSVSRARIRSTSSTPIMLKIKVTGLRKITADNFVVSYGFGHGRLHDRRRKM